MATKQKFEGAALILVQALQASDSAMVQIIAAVNGALSEGWGTEGTMPERKAALIDWAHDVAEEAGMMLAYNTLRNYISNTAAIALAPEVTATIETGPKDKKSIRTITAGDVQNKRELEALAKAANASLGVKSRGKTGAKHVNSGLAVAAPIDAPKDTRTPEEMKRDAFRILAEQAEEKEKQFVTMLLDAVSGKNDHLRKVADNALRGVGMRLTAIVAEKVAEPVKVLANPVIVVSRGQKAAATRRENQAAK